MCTGTHPFIPVANTARVRMVYTQYGQTVMNVFYWKGDVPFIASALSTLVDSVVTNWNSILKPMQSPNVTLDFVEATALDSDGAPQVTEAVGTAGTLPGTAAPGGTTIAIKFSTGLSGRSFRGRMYWIGLNLTTLNGDQISSAGHTMLATNIPAFFDAVETDTGYNHVVVSYCNAGAWRSTGVATPVLFYILVDDNLDSQRRRLAGRGI